MIFEKYEPEIEEEVDFFGDYELQEIIKDAAERSQCKVTAEGNNVYHLVGSELSFYDFEGIVEVEGYNVRDYEFIQLIENTMLYEKRVVISKGE